MRGITRDPALERLGQIVRAADVKGQESIAAEGVGLRAIAEGFAAPGLSDDERLRRQIPMYDALYAHAQQHAGQRAAFRSAEEEDLDA